jgi:hypothetical protein
MSVEVMDLNPASAPAAAASSPASYPDSKPAPTATAKCTACDCERCLETLGLLARNETSAVHVLENHARAIAALKRDNFWLWLCVGALAIDVLLILRELRR